MAANKLESTDSTQRSNDQHEESNILTIGDSSEDKEWRQTPVGGMFVTLRV